MSKKNKQVAKAAASTDGTETTAKPVVSVQIIKAVKKDGKYRGAREAWYGLLVAHEGKPVNEFYAAAKEKPPALTKAGTAEDPRGWMRYFVRNHVAELGT